MPVLFALRGPGTKGRKAKIMVQSYYHLRGQIIGRGQKQAKSCVAAAAYRSGEKLKDERQGRICKYDKKEVAYSEILVPQHAPDWCKERGKLWNSVEAAEKSKNAQLAREINMTLAPELSLEQNKSMLLEYVNENFISRGMIADVNIHNKPDNLHAHIMLTMREIDRDGEWLAKSRKEYITDGNGERIKLDSGEWKSRKVDCNDWNSKNTYNTWCENWSKTVNRHLEKAGSENRIDHRSYKKQGINQIPTIHLGPNVSAMEKKGIRTEKGDINREIRARNAEIKKEIEPIKSKLSEAEDEVIIAFNAIIERAREKMLLYL